MERMNRGILISGIISAVLGLLAGFLGGRLAVPPVPEAQAVMRAEHFQVVDQAGQVRGRLGVDEQGVARLAFFGQDAAVPLVSLALNPQGGSHRSWATNAGAPWCSKPNPRTPRP
jgi:hypothetical protein